MQNGRNCYVIDSMFEHGLLDSVKSMLPAIDTTKMPAGNRLIIDNEIVRATCMETISNSGASGTRMEIRGIVHNAAISDDLFLPPNGLQLELPKSVVEYTSVLGKLIRARSDARVRQVRGDIEQKIERRLAEAGPQRNYRRK